MARLSGDKKATIEKAQEILNKAKAEARGKGVGLRTRQAAEKVWLAVTTAADALTGGTSTTAQVMAAFNRAWGNEGLIVAKDVHNAMHISCFYSDSKTCDGAYVDDHIVRLGKILHTPPNGGRHGRRSRPR